MTTTAATWFYRDPERIPYYLEERVNQTFWQARFGDFWLDATSASPPYRMVGEWLGTPIAIEWKPNDYFTLRVPEDSDAARLVTGITRMLAIHPTLDYANGDGEFVTEWHVDGGADRWQEIQGKAGYVNPQRLSR